MGHLGATEPLQPGPLRSPFTAPAPRSRLTAYRDHDVVVCAKPFAFALAGMTPCPFTLSCQVVPTVDRPYTLTVESLSMLKICCWHDVVVRQSCP